MNLYSILRLLGWQRRKITEDTLAQVERDEAAARQRTIEQAKRIRDEAEKN